MHDTVKLSERAQRAIEVLINGGYFILHYDYLSIEKRDTVTLFDCAGNTMAKHWIKTFNELRDNHMLKSRPSTHKVYTRREWVIDPKLFETQLIISQRIYS